MTALRKGKTKEARMDFDLVSSRAVGQLKILEH